MKTLRIDSGRAKALWHGHPWVFAASIKAAGRVEETFDVPVEPDLVRVNDIDGRTLGFGLESPKSAIRVRMLYRGEQPRPESELWSERIARAVDLRMRIMTDATRTNVYRLVHSEADDLPGLVVDRLGDVLIAQFSTGPMFVRRQMLTNLLLKATGCKGLIARAGGRESDEGISPQDVPFEVGEVPAGEIELMEEGMAVAADPRKGQKTGHYADQRENRLRVAELARNCTVLDLFCGSGGFAIQALRHGATSVMAVDSSKGAMERLERCADQNDVGAKIERVVDDVDKVLASLKKDSKQFDIVVCDPPNWIPSRDAKRRALKRYRELNVRAMTRVNSSGGLLASFSCTGQLTSEELYDLLRSASRDCRRHFRVLRELAAGPDHPVHPHLPSSRYLNGYILQLLPVDETIAS